MPAKRKKTEVSAADKKQKQEVLSQAVNPAAAAIPTSTLAASSSSAAAAAAASATAPAVADMKMPMPETNIIYSDIERRLSKEDRARVSNMLVKERLAYMRSWIGESYEPEIANDSKADDGFKNLLAKAMVGDAAAQYRIARLLLNEYVNSDSDPKTRSSCNVKKDENKAKYWIELAALHGYLPAQNHLAVCYQKGIGGVLPDSEKANQWYGYAAEQGEPLALFNLGVSYVGGADELGISKDVKLGEQFLLRALDKNSLHAAESLFILAKDYASQDEKTVTKSKSLLDRIATKIPAITRLLVRDFAPTKDGTNDKFIDELLTKAGQGDQKAQRKIAIYLVCSKDPDRFKATRWFTLGAVQHEPYSQYMMAWFYQNGIALEDVVDGWNKGTFFLLQASERRGGDVDIIGIIQAEIKELVIAMAQAGIDKVEIDYFVVEVEKEIEGIKKSGIFSSGGNSSSAAAAAAQSPSPGLRL